MSGSRKRTKHSVVVMGTIWCDSGSTTDKHKKECSDANTETGTVRMNLLNATHTPVDGSELSPTDGKVTVRSECILVHETMERAVHGLDLELLFIDGHLVEHVILVEIKVTGRLPKVEVGNMRCVDKIVSTVDVGLLPKVFNLLPDGRSLGVPKDESTPGILLDGEQVEVLSENTVVTLFRFLHELLEGLELSRVLPGGSVHTLQHLPAFVSLPVRTGHTLQLERLFGDLSGAFDLFTVDNRPEIVSDLAYCHNITVHSLKDLRQERLVGLLHHGLRILPADFLCSDGQVIPNDLVHRLLDGLQVLVRELP